MDMVVKGVKKSKMMKTYIYKKLFKMKKLNQIL